MLSSQNQSWLDGFIERTGRAPRVLHIGNIANNAYNNAKILNEAGLENHVICYDYYHIMACPEWEDADFPEFTGDQFRPEWHRLKLNGFQRPRWFIQGPLKLCLRAFDSMMRNRPEVTELQRDCLKASGYLPLTIEAKQGLHQFKALCFLLPSRRMLLDCLKNKVPKLHRVLRWSFQKAFKSLLWLSSVRHSELSKRINSEFSQEFRDVPALKSAEYSQEFQAGCRLQRQDFCPRGKFSLDDVLPYFGITKHWDTEVFKHVDLILGYSTDPLLPLICGKDFFAFEHGTIREIPYQDSSQGRLTALAYRKATHVFVTNFDCRSSAEFLAPSRFTMINHPFDEDHGKKVTGWEDLRRKLQHELDSDHLLFHPTRQDWVEGTGYADKANDVFLKAFCALRSQGLKIGLVCCEWGNNVSASKQLVAQEKCSRYVKWVQPLPVVAFERTCLACDIVVDQFKLGSFGGVLFKAMAVGRPILTFLDEKQVLNQYAECPPVINCRTQQGITDALLRVLSRSNELERLGKLSRDWITKHHGKAATVNAQVDQFRLFDLSKRERSKDSSS